MLLERKFRVGLGENERSHFRSNGMRAPTDSRARTHGGKLHSDGDGEMGRKARS